MQRDKRNLWIFLFLIGAQFLSGCSSDKSVDEDEANIIACTAENLLETFTTLEGDELFIYADGQVFTQTNTSCDFTLQYFDPDFRIKNYVVDNSGTFLKDENILIPVKNNYTNDFEDEEDFLDLFVMDINSSDLFWTNFTLQSPSAKTVSEYVELSGCILNNQCDFLDNSISIVRDPLNIDNSVISFSSVSPTADMVTAKCSLTSVLAYFEKGSDIWFEADYFIQEGMPYSIVDFETSYFEVSPGPRVVIRNNRLEFENKFGAKTRFNSNTTVQVPFQEWFTVKVHLKLSNSTDGILELWQDEELLISTNGINLPTSNAIQNIFGNRNFSYRRRNSTFNG